MSETLQRCESGEGGIKDFIKLVDDEFEDVSDIAVQGWLSNFCTDAILTP